LSKEKAVAILADSLNPKFFERKICPAGVVRQIRLGFAGFIPRNAKRFRDQTPATLCVAGGKVIPDFSLAHLVREKFGMTPSPACRQGRIFL
jgi:hypothetical protein